MELENIILKSIKWRQDQISNWQNEAIRLFAGRTDGIEGLLIDQFGPLLLVTIYCPDLIAHKDNILKTLNKSFPKKSILVKARSEKDTNDYQYFNNHLYDKDAIYSCYEGDCEFEIHCDPTHDYGLYLDTKAARNFLATLAPRKKILNLFSYTCAFAIKAMKSNANTVVNIDPNRDYLNWGGRNADLNQVVIKRYADTTEDYLARHLRRLSSGKDQPYDIVVFDPPAFLVGRGANRLARNMWPKWMSYLQETQCHHFIIVINDKSLKNKDLKEFFSEGLGEKIKISEIEQSIDVQGQNIDSGSDAYYRNPSIFYIQR